MGRQSNDKGTEQKSVEMQNGIRTSCLVPDGKLTSYYYDDAKTTHECFLRGLKVSNNGPCLGDRRGRNEYHWMTYQEVYDRARNLGSGLVAKGHAASNESLIGIFSNNCPEWFITEQACSMYSMVVVPLYDTLGLDACHFIISQTEMETVIVDKPEKISLLVKLENKSTTTLKRIIFMGKLDEYILKEAEAAGCEVLTMTDLERLGQENPSSLNPPKPSDLCTICYTSGTTGNPKGAMITHENIVSAVGAILHMTEIEFVPEDIHLSYLPLAHMMERLLQAMLITKGARIGFYGGDVKKLLDDVGLLKPTVFITVPRLLNRIHGKVLQGVNQAGGLKKLFFNMALKRKTALLKRGIVTRDTIWDKIVFAKIQNMLGGRVRLVITGSAPLSAAVLDFARCAFGCVVHEGYGQTEAAAVVTVTPTNDFDRGHVGVPLSCNLVKLADVPDMNYYAKDQQGEICVKGNNVMVGYYKDEEMTEEAFDADGWLHTGDIGMWRPNGTLEVIDRKKHIFKLAQGEYIAPEKIENIYVQCPLVAQVFVDGHSIETFPVAVVVPDPEVLPGWAEKKGIKGSMEELCQHKVVKQEILQALHKKGDDAKLNGFEQVKEIKLHPELFSQENGMLTPTFKSKRPVLRKYFANEITNLYKAANSAKIV